MLCLFHSLRISFPRPAISSFFWIPGSRSLRSQELQPQGPRPGARHSGCLPSLPRNLSLPHLRVPRHCENAQRVAEWLEANPKVKWVNYCGLKSNKYYELAQKYLPNGSCGVIAFGLKGTREDTVKFMDALKLACIVTHVADARTCVLHPASHTHRQLSDEQLIEAGVAPDLIRLSVGIENVNDIIADLEQALTAF